MKRTKLIDRLLPKYKFPCAVHDCYEAYKWIIDNSEMLGVDINKIIVEICFSIFVKFLNVFVISNHFDGEEYL